MQSKIFRWGARLLRFASAPCVLTVVLLVAGAPATFAQDLGGECGQLSLSGRFGPFDYRADRYIREPTYGSHRAILQMVEGFHFTPEVESLLRGKNSAGPMGDLAYTLHSFPNHHRALISLVNLSRRERAEKPKDSPYTVDCWFRRAIAWRSDDNIVRLIYADHLSRSKQEARAVEQLEFAGRQAGDNAFTHQNIGLIYFELKNFEKALFHAHRAQELGLVHLVLVDQLKGVNKWAEPLNHTGGEVPKISP